MHKLKDIVIYVHINILQRSENIAGILDQICDMSKHSLFKHPTKLLFKHFFKFSCDNLLK